jgi:hypothetical protein
MASSWKSLNPSEKVCRAHNLLWWAIILPIIAIAFTYTAVTNCLHLQAIKADHSVAQAIISYDESDQTSKHVTRFRYAFDVAGKTYDGIFVKPNSMADQVEIGGTIPIAYANFDPNQSMREDVLAANGDMKTSLISAATMTALGALLVGLFWLAISYFIVWPRVRSVG